MREILFKGKRIDNGEWIEGYYCPCVFGRFPFIPAIIIKEDMDNGHWHPVEIIPSTIGQYTGLTDKNGKKIFEGDVVSTDLERPYNMFNCNDGGQDYYAIMLPILRSEHTRYEYGKVIGNIYDNPELSRRSDTE